MCSLQRRSIDDYKMAPSYISADDILLLNDDLTEVTGSAEHAVTSTNIGDVHEA